MENNYERYKKTYAYRAGQRIELQKSTDQMVVRALPDKLDDSAIVASEQVSSAVLPDDERSA